MRVYQFITLFLALGVACGCSHRRAQQHPVAATLCDCSTCRCEQQRLISTGAVPAEHFSNATAPVVPAATVPVSESLTASPKMTRSNDLSPEYASDPGDEVVDVSPFSSGNPIDIDEAPQQFNIPKVDDIKSAPNQIPSDTLQLDTAPGNLPSLGQSSAKGSSENAFQPFNPDLFKVKSKIGTPVPPDQQPSILIEKVSEASQPDLGDATPPSQFQLSLSEPDSSDFEIPDSIAAAPAAVELDQSESVEPEADKPEPHANSIKSVANLATPDFAANVRSSAPQARSTETVVQGELYEDPIVLYARQRRGRLASRPVQPQRAAQPASIQTPVKHQRITQDSQLDPVYGLPLNNQVQFNSLPAIAAPQPVLVAEAQLAPATDPQHLHVHIHHDYGNNPVGVQGPVAYQNDQPSANVQVVYRDDKGRVIMAPPTPTNGVSAAMPTGDQRTYYVPPKQILRLKAVSPIDQPRSNPSVASIQMRDTVVHGGNHLLTKPEYQAQAVHTNHGLPGIDHEKLREAFRNSPSGNSLR